MLDGTKVTISRRTATLAPRLYEESSAKMILHGTFRSVDEQEHAIYAWLAGWNHEPRTLV